MRIVTIIPARGGSKSLPNKNILPLNNIPLLAYSINYSKSCPIIEKTIVSTDSVEISKVAEKYGALVPFIRPEEYAQDDTQDYPVIRHALDFFEGKGEVFDVYILLRPTSPLRPEGLIETSIEILESNKSISSVRSVAKIKEHPYRSWKICEDGSMRGFVDEVYEPYNIPRQFLPELYFQTGDIEVIRRETIIKGSVSGANVFPVIIDHEEMIDIDSRNDLIKAEGKIVQ